MTGHATGAPGMPPTWASSDKDFVIAALGRSRLWTTVGHGVLNEIYWPSTGRPRTRDVTFYLRHEDGTGAWLDLKRIASYDLATPGPRIPLLTVRHSGALDGESYALDLEFLPDGDRDALLVTWSVEGPWRFVVIAAPHIDAQGCRSRAWVEDATLFASDDDGTPALCIAANGGFEAPSAGYVGASDGWRDLEANGRLTLDWDEAGPGNVALSAECVGASGQFAIAMAGDARGARTLARATLADATQEVRRAFIAEWEEWARSLCLPAAGPAPASREAALHDAALLSAVVLKAHEDHGFPGAAVASLSTPWGSSTDTLGGYHLVWPRDTVMTAFAFLAMGHRGEARRTLAHLIAVQNADGSWPQNCYPSGEPFWTGVQLDEGALPIMLATKLQEIGEPPLDGATDMILRAARFIARSGPSSPQDRWEENAGVNPYTLATLIAGLVAAAPWLPAPEAEEALDLADEWRERISEWCWVDASRWTKELGIPGHFIRLRPPASAPLGTEVVELRNRDGETIPAADLVAMDFSYLSRLGVIPDDDPRIPPTIQAAAAALAIDTPSGTVWHRYVSDGYGEKSDGAPFDGSGIGRGWPFLSGERGHLALMAGEDVLPYLEVMLACRSKGGLMPEQVWDAPAIPERGLWPGRPSGSAMPLLWTHAEFIKLLAARASGKPTERLAAVEARYGAEPRPAILWRWRDATPVRELPAKRCLAVECERPFCLHFGLDGWDAPRNSDSEQGAFGLHRVVLRPKDLGEARRIVFTRRIAGTWEGRDHEVRIAAAD